MLAQRIATSPLQLTLIRGSDDTTRFGSGREH
jgi:hypothetical protein